MSKEVPPPKPKKQWLAKIRQRHRQHVLDSFHITKISYDTFIPIEVCDMFSKAIVFGIAILIARQNRKKGMGFAEINTPIESGEFPSFESLNL